MNFPKKIYAIFPYGGDGRIAGVYVGVTKNIKTRMANHFYDCSSLQPELHNLMRENGFSYLVLGEVPHYRDGYLEYDWIDFFLKRTNLRVFNKSVGLSRCVRITPNADSSSPARLTAISMKSRPRRKRIISTVIPCCCISAGTP